MAYFSNGSAGSYLGEQCCDCTLHFESPCPVYLLQSEYNYKQVGNDDLRDAMNILIDASGKCQMRLCMAEHADKDHWTREIGMIPADEKTTVTP